jgi:hypothetical protein
MKWMVYAQAEPFGEERADLRMGILAALTFNINRDPEKTEAAQPEDFMPKFGKEPEVLSKEDAIAALDAAFTSLAIAAGGYKP